MLYDHKVKVNGKWYAVGEEVPEKAEKKASANISYTKTDINRMSVSDLRQLLERLGITGAESLTGAEMKETLIAFYGL